MRVLFYLPVVTPWWFDHIVEPLIRLLAPVADVRVLAPEPWSGTGVGERELARLADVPRIGWTLVGGAAHPSLRDRPADPATIQAWVRDLAPDYVLCRSADFDTPARFPGKVRYLMEGAVAPVPVAPHWIWLADAPFDHGSLPDLADGDAAQLEDWIAPAWARLRAQALKDAAAPHSEDRRLCVALDYEHEENFFVQHRCGARPNAAFVRALAADLAPGFALDVADHPLNILHVDRQALAATVAELAPRVTLAGPAASCLARADGLVVTDSKAFALAALLEKPLCRLTRFHSADWLNAYPDLARFQADIAAGRARRPDTRQARRWSAWHLANNIVDPQDPALTPDAFLAHLDRPHDPARWARGMARVAANAPELFA